MNEEQINVIYMEQKLKLIITIVSKSVKVHEDILEGSEVIPTWRKYSKQNQVKK